MADYYMIKEIAKTDSQLVWLGLSNLVVSILKQTGALIAYHECMGNVKNDFLEIVHKSISRQLLMDISKLFDRSQTCGNDNCSILKLRESCLKEVTSFSGEANDIHIKKIDALVEQFEKTISRNVRNKKMAHFDLTELFMFNDVRILFSDIELLIENLVTVISEIGSCLFPITVTYPTIDEYTKAYKSAIIELKKNFPEV